MRARRPSPVASIPRLVMAPMAISTSTRPRICCSGRRQAEVGRGARQSATHPAAVGCLRPGTHSMPASRRAPGALDQSRWSRTTSRTTGTPTRCRLGKGRRMVGVARAHGTHGTHNHQKHSVGPPQPHSDLRPSSRPPPAGVTGMCNRPERPVTRTGRSGIVCTMCTWRVPSQLHEGGKSHTRSLLVCESSA